MPWGDRTHGRNAPRSIRSIATFRLGTREALAEDDEDDEDDDGDGVRDDAIDEERSTAMVANMLRVALYTVTYCRGATTGE